MAVNRTRTIKNKHATNKAGISGSKGSKKAPADGVVKSRKPKPGGGGAAAAPTQIKGRARIADLLKKRKKRTYSEAELGLPKLNAITPVGVQKPKGKKKGKIFVDDRESMNTILAMVQAEKEGQIESKMIKARQMEEIREARRIEAEKKEGERKAKLEDTKEALRKKRKRPRPSSGGDAEDVSIRDIVSAGTKAGKPKTKKKVAFA